MTVLVTGANGFVGAWVVRALLAGGHSVIAAAGPDLPAGTGQAEVRWTTLDLQSFDSVQAAARQPVDAVIHLAALASGAEALLDPGLAWTVNAGGTARLLHALGERRRSGEADPVVLLVSTAEVYGAAPRPLVETDPLRPRSAYAASKVGAELAARETAERTGLRVIIARPFPHTGPGQTTRFVVPAFAERLRRARATGARTVTVGNLDVTRDMLDVRDVSAAYLALLQRGAPGEVYNVASGAGQPLRRVFDTLARIVGVSAEPVADPQLVRAVDLPCLVGDATKLRTATGWQPAIAFDQTLQDVVDAQAH